MNTKKTCYYMAKTCSNKLSYAAAMHVAQAAQHVVLAA